MFDLVDLPNGSLVREWIQEFDVKLCFVLRWIQQESAFYFEYQTIDFVLHGICYKRHGTLASCRDSRLTLYYRLCNAFASCYWFHFIMISPSWHSTQFSYYLQLFWLSLLVSDILMRFSFSYTSKSSMGIHFRTRECYLQLVIFYFEATKDLSMMESLTIKLLSSYFKCLLSGWYFFEGIMITVWSILSNLRVSPPNCILKKI